MKKNLSVINLRLIELKKYFLLKVLGIFILLILVLWGITSLYFFPLIFNNSYSDFILKKLYFLYSFNQIDNIDYIIILIYVIEFLFSFLLLTIFYYSYNKSYQKFYQEILLNELKLYDYELIDNSNVFDSRLETILTRYIHFKKVSKQEICKIKKDNLLTFYQLNIFHDKIKYGGLIVFYKNKNDNQFFQINSYGTCSISEHNQKGIFEYNYYDPRKNNKFSVYSTLSKKTNQICDKEFLDEFNKFQNFCGNQIIITSVNNLIILVIPRWKFKFSKSLTGKIQELEIESKTESIDKIYNYLKYFHNKIERNG